MNYFKATERYLYNYRAIKTNIEILEQQLEMVKSDFKGASAVDTTREPVSKTYKFTSATEDEVLQREGDIAKLEEEILRQKNVVEKIDKAIALLPELERAVVNMKYISGEGLSWVQIAERVGYSVDHCKGKVRRKAVERVAVVVYGLKALDSFKPLPLFEWVG